MPKNLHISKKCCNFAAGFDMKMKKYILPTTEILPFGMLCALCTSGEVQEGLGGGENGGNPWDDGRIPQRTAVF